MNDEEAEDETTPSANEEATTEWSSSMKVMNQISNFEATTESATESFSEVETTANPSPMTSQESATENSRMVDETTELKIDEETAASAQMDEQITATSESGVSIRADDEVLTTNSSTDDYETTTSDSSSTVSDETSTVEMTTNVA
jgi:hypothetical protein